MVLNLLCIPDLHTAIKFCKFHRFPGDTNLLHIRKSVKQLNKFVDFDLRNVSNWLNANKISMNVSKTELIILKTRMKKSRFWSQIKIKWKKN